LSRNLRNDLWTEPKLPAGLDEELADVAGAAFPDVKKTPGGFLSEAFVDQ
jgi:hypothetical protein